MRGESGNLRGTSATAAGGSGEDVGDVKHRLRSHLWLLIVVALTMVLQTAPSPAFEESGGRQDNYTFCFNSTVNANRKARYRDGNRTWEARQSLTTNEVSCSNSGALTVRVQGIDGFGNVLAEVHFNILGNPVDVTFDSAETWWEATSAPPGTAADFWGVAAHEIGHIWGLEHTCDSCTSPQGEWNTMNRFARVYDSVNGSENRDLTSDDEAGIQWVKNLKYMPNFSFERVSDSVSGLRTVSAFYWGVTGGWTRICGDGNAQHASCYERTTTTGTLKQSVYRRVCFGCQIQLSLQNRNASSTAGRLRIIVKDLTANVTLANRTCSVPALSLWAPCVIVFSPNSSDRRLYEYSITNEIAGPQIRLDNVTVQDTT
jgi:hypothetical protein